MGEVENSLLSFLLHSTWNVSPDYSKVTPAPRFCHHLSLPTISFSSARPSLSLQSLSLFFYSFIQLPVCSTESASSLFSSTPPPHCLLSLLSLLPIVFLLIVMVDHCWSSFFFVLLLLRPKLREKIGFFLNRAFVLKTERASLINSRFTNANTSELLNISSVEK